MKVIDKRCIENIIRLDDLLSLVVNSVSKPNHSWTISESRVLAVIMLFLERLERDMPQARKMNLMTPLLKVVCKPEKKNTEES
jgi:hypothetical protein